jgi:hypothetical protein
MLPKPIALAIVSVHVVGSQVKPIRAEPRTQQTDLDSRRVHR